MGEVQAPSRKDGYKIVPDKGIKAQAREAGEKLRLLVVDTVHDRTSIDKVNERLISDSRAAICDSSELNARDLDREVSGCDDGNGTTFILSNG